MCGIAGFAGTAAPNRMGPAQRALDIMAGCLRHRGPDDAGTWLDSSQIVGLAHRRLAIVDLSINGHQPMDSDDGRFIVAFNGEIYNHRALRQGLDERSATGAKRWKGVSDTETLVEGFSTWGVRGTIAKCVGMFALAVFDRRERRLTLVRDRAGEKPLYYVSALGFIAFASEPKAILALPGFDRRLDRASLSAYLAFGYVPGTGSMFASIKKVPPAGILEFAVDQGTVALDHYWRLPPPAPSRSTPGLGRELDDRLESILAEAVAAQLQADVPVAVLLSGGMDSSLVAAMAARAVGRVRTFTIGFPGAKAHDERPHARLIAEHFGTEHVEIPLQSGDLGTLQQLSRWMDEPLCDSSIIPTYLVSQAVRRHVTVALGGDGGDELFGGYRAYNLARVQALLRRVLPALCRQLAAGAARAALPPGTKGRSYLVALDSTKIQAAARAVMLFDRQARGQLLAGSAGSGSPMPEQLKEQCIEEDLSVIQTATRMDFLNYLPNDLLTKVDRASMLCSLEVRAPFLDHRLVEFAFGQVPDDLKAGWRKKKIMLSRLARRVLPPLFNVDRKQGFSIPLRSWLQLQKGTEIHDSIRALPRELINPAYVDRLLAWQARGYDNSERILCLAMLSFWLQEFRVKY